jgi:basic amino acid/polyamine antiporter, APA family
VSVAPEAAAPRPGAPLRGAPLPGAPLPGAPLRRELGLFSAVLLVVGGTIGSGIFFTPAEVARSLPDGASILLVWALGGAVALAGALTYAELGAMMPDAGGPYVYIREAFGKLPAFLFGWMALASIASGAIAAVSLGFAGYVGRMVDLAPAGGERGLAVATIAAVSLTNYFGLKPGVVAQNALTIAKIAALVALILAGAVLWQRLAPPAGVEPPAPAGPASFAGAFVPVLFTIGGWQQMNMVAGEIRDPGRLVPRALAIGVGVVVACYLGVNAVYLRVLGRDGLAASSAIAADTAARLLGPRGATAITIGALVSILGLVHVVVFTTPRVLFAMARDRAFFAAAARVHPRFGSPHVAIAILGGWAVVLLLLAGGKIGALLGGVVFADWIFFGLGAASVFVLRRRRPGAARPYRVLGYPVVPAFFVIAACAGVASAVLASPRTSLVGAALLAAGALVFTLRGSRSVAQSEER